MKIACLQFAPQVGDVDNNLNRADSVLSKANPDEIDLLVLPELAFSGRNLPHGGIWIRENGGRCQSPVSSRDGRRRCVAGFDVSYALALTLKRVQL